MSDIAADRPLSKDLYSDHVFVFRGRRDDLNKVVIWWDGYGVCIFSERLESGRFVWPSLADCKVAITPAQLSMFLEGVTGEHRKAVVLASCKIAASNFGELHFDGFTIGMIRQQ